MRWVCCLMMLAVSCRGFDTNTHVVDPAEMGNAQDLAQNQKIVISAPESWSEMCLHGLKIGDDSARINPARISSADEKSGWTILRDTNRYRIKKGKIDGLGIWDQKLIQRLDIKSEDQIPTKFGKPQSSIPISTNVTVYEYQDAHLHVFWNSLEKRLVGVEVTK